MEKSTKAGPDPYPGTVKRLLNFRDRLLILSVLTEDTKGKGDLKTLSRIQKLHELLDGEGVEVFFDAMDIDFQKRYSEWVDANRKYSEDSTKPAPGKRPRRSKIDQRGKDATFHIPSKLDSYIQEVLGRAQLPTQQAEFAVELAVKFGVKVED